MSLNTRHNNCPNSGILNLKIKLIKHKFLCGFNQILFAVEMNYYFLTGIQLINKIIIFACNNLLPRY